MDNSTIGGLFFVLTLALAAFRVPIAISMILTGGVGFALLSSPDAVLNMLKSTTYHSFSSYSLIVIPLFILMGQFATKAKMNIALFNAARAWIGHRRGGLALASITGCAMFGAICGSSLATAATMTQIAQPEMERHGYSKRLSSGSLAAGGTLGILIPPSVILVIYAVYTEQSIGQLFFAAIVPGILAMIGYLVTVTLLVHRNPELAPAAERTQWNERFRAIGEIWHVVLIFVLVIAGIYLGWFSPTEGAAVGASAMALVGLVTRTLTLAVLRDCLLETAKTTGFIALIILGAALFSSFIALSRLPSDLAGWVGGLDVSPLLVVAAMLLVYIILGCVMESLAMVLLTVPVFLPILLSIDLGMTETQTMIWFGILCLSAVEIGMITPPFGLNLFVIKSAAKDLEVETIYAGVLPFVLSDIIRLAILLLFPVITLFAIGG